MLKGTVAHAQSVKRDDSPKPDMDISQLGGVVLSGGGTTTMDISQLGGVVLYEEEEIIHFQDIKHVSSSTMIGMSNDNVTEIVVTLPNLTGIDIESSILLMTIMHRSTVTAPPGWSLVYEQPVGASNQVTAVYKKDVLSSLDSGAASTWNQSSSARFIGQAHLFTSGVQNKKVVVDSASGATGTSLIEITPITGSDYGEVAFVTASFNIAQASGTTTLTGPSGYALLSPPSIAYNRLAVAYKVLKVGETSSGTFKTSSSNSNASSISLKLKLEEVV